MCSLQKSISKLIFAGYTGSKNQVRNRLRIQFVELDFSKLIFQKSSADQQGVTIYVGFIHILFDSIQCKARKESELGG